MTNGHRVGAPPLNEPPNVFGRLNVLPSVVTPAKFGFDRLTRFCSTGGRNRLFPILSRTAHTTVLCTTMQHCDSAIELLDPENVGVAVGTEFLYGLEAEI